MLRSLGGLMALALGVLMTTASALPAQATAPPEPVRHIVVFKYKAGASEEQIRQVTEAFAALRTKIPGIVSFEHGVNNSPEKLNQGFTHVYQVTFTGAAARDAYLPHPAHKAFGELLGRLGVLESVFVVDYAPVHD
jgi:hypothetical protein